MLKTAIRDNDPVIFLEHKMLYGAKCAVPAEEYLIALGKADIKKQGDDVTIISWGANVAKALSAASELEKENISAEVIDLRSIKPLDTRTIINSVKKTNRVVITHESPVFGGFGGEIAALISDQAFGYLDAPIKRVAAAETPIPFAPTLEDAYLPSVRDIIAAVRGMF